MNKLNVYWLTMMRYWLLVIMILFLSACMQSLSKTTSRSEIALQELKSKLSHQSTADNQLLLRRLLRMPHQSGFEHFITEVIKNNANLKSIQVTAKMTRYTMDISAAEKKPKINLNFTGVRSKDALTHFTSNRTSMALDMSWAVDIWGRLADQQLSTEYLAAQSEYQFLHAKRVLIVQAANTWINYWGDVQMERNIHQLKHLYKRLVNHYQDAYRNGLVDYNFLREAKNNHIQFSNRSHQVSLQKVKSINYMNMLRGQLKLVSNGANGQKIDSKMPISRMEKFLPVLNHNISHVTLANRPDIQAAFAELKALEYSARAAHKALLPQLNINTSMFKSASNLSRAFNGNLVWELVGGVTQAVFNSGQLRAIAAQKSTAAEVSWYQYRDAVLNALLEVQNTINAESLLSEQLLNKQQLVINNQQQSLSARERYRDGAMVLGDYLQMRAELLVAQGELIVTQVEYLTNGLALAVALGLPIESLWENKSE